MNWNQYLILVLALLSLIHQIILLEKYIFFSYKIKLISNFKKTQVFTRDELEHIASLCQKHDVICISDEVYEWIVYDKNKHIRMATLPNMWERTLTIGSAGKTFSSTGLKLGWTIGPEHLIRPCQIVHQVI
jgi:hypothetical protein